MSTFMLRRPNSAFGASSRPVGGEEDFAGIATNRTAPHTGGAAATRKAAQSALKTLTISLVSAGLIVCAPSLAAEAALPSKPQPQSEPSKAVQSRVDKQAADAATEKRKKLLADATAAIAQTQQALKALEDKKTRRL